MTDNIWYVNTLLPSSEMIQAGFRKGRGTRDQIANICWIMEKAAKEKDRWQKHAVALGRNGSDHFNSHLVD